MKTNKIIAVAAVLAMTVSGCTKDNLSIRLLSEPMNFGAKVLMDPTAINDAEWIEGEQINLNGVTYSISKRGGSYYIDLNDPINVAMTAVYPATVDANGNNVTFDGTTLTINSLNVDFRTGGQSIIFPMAAEAAAGSEALKFDHLTGGLKLTLTDTSTSKDYTLGSLRIVTYGNGATADPIDPRHGVTACWAVQGLAVPGGMVGGNGNSVDAKYATQMDFTITANGNPGKAIDHQGSISVCVPITVSSVKTLMVMGFGTDGTQLFSRTATYDPVLTEVQANHMYLVPQIKF